MPLILFTGYPCSGKTTMAKELMSLLNEKIKSEPSLSKYTITYHSDETLGIEHSDYITSQSERKLRSKITSAVKRDLSKTNIVIVDSLNYIKGFRYQLHCEVKNLSTTFSLIQIMCPYETTIQWNDDKPDFTTKWDHELIDQLIQRYEEPNPQNRWDSPLFPILINTDTMQDHFDNICSAIFKTNKNSKITGNNKNLDPLNNALNKPNSVTILKPANKENFIQVIDSECAKIIKIIMNHIKTMESIGNYSNNSTRIIVSENVTDINDDRCVYVDLPLSNVNLAKLQRLKRQFVALNRVRDMDTDRIMPLFADYLNRYLNDE
ncbi:Kti12p NDAI_0K01510 [Naumovozyma dairenensis CBS 421]|uniref:Protein KTI12 n=1 Tax=Naumovozyma dairenensis (strain ATCC 10597 / BCRC 20456 / CBS 421 / NBRC 0211 / NRRL Y-12639) TaxID=1071378 RepID=G0WHT1_NAUDC|nr:hypothetical protein NDAI_0K01510 [Naumovozyma dairenensis CBS 421]CCD27342.1 hypothetical protein NDAI_0K01510 [Naumovozyma dairenensis CBS 421]